MTMENKWYQLTKINLKLNKNECVIKYAHNYQMYRVNAATTMVLNCMTDRSRVGEWLNVERLFWIAMFGQEDTTYLYRSHSRGGLMLLLLWTH